MANYNHWFLEEASILGSISTLSKKDITEIITRFETEDNVANSAETVGVRKAK